MDNFKKYFLLGIVFWLITDWTTVFQPDLRKWLSFWPEVWVFYAGYPAVFAFLIYKRKWNDKKIFMATLLGAFIVEIIFTHNALLYTFPVMFLAVPASMVIYGFVTFLPKWMVEGTLEKNWRQALMMTIVWILISMATFVGNTRPDS